MIKIEFYSESEWEITEYLFLGLELSGSYKTTTRDHYSSWVTIKKTPHHRICVVELPQI
jgi:hypothetical protein